LIFVYFMCFKVIYVELCEHVVCLFVYNYLGDFMLFKKIGEILLFWRIMKIGRIIINY